MKTIGLFEAKAKLSELCGKVAETGEVYTITRRGKPLVRIMAVEAEPDPAHEFRHLSVWVARAAIEKKYGPLTEEFELPRRKANPARYKNPLDD